jgi:hypothetical protein
LRGFAARAERVERRAASLLDGADAAAAAALLGARAAVYAVYSGEPADGLGRAVIDLAAAETVIDNVEAGRPPLGGLTGWVPLGLAGDGAPVQMRLRVPSPAAAGTEARPLVLFMPGMHAWDGEARGQAFDATAPPGVLAAALEHARFDRDGAYLLAVMESPGSMRDGVASVAAAIAAIDRLLPVDRGRQLLVGEREGAFVVATAAARGAVPARGLVLVAGGGLTREDARLFADTRVLVVPAAGHLGVDNASRIAELAAEAGHGDRVTVVGTETAWPWALWQHLGDVERFAARVLADGAPAPRRR